MLCVASALKLVAVEKTQVNSLSGLWIPPDSNYSTEAQVVSSRSRTLQQ